MNLVKGSNKILFHTWVFDVVSPMTMRTFALTARRWLERIPWSWWSWNNKKHLSCWWRLFVTRWLSLPDHNRLHVWRIMMKEFFYWSVYWALTLLCCCSLWRTNTKKDHWRNCCWRRGGTIADRSDRQYNPAEREDSPDPFFGCNPREKEREKKWLQRKEMKQTNISRQHIRVWNGGRALKVSLDLDRAQLWPAGRWPQG